MDEPQHDWGGCLVTSLLLSAFFLVALVGGWLLILFLLTKKWNHL